MVEYVEKQTKEVDVWKIKKYECIVKPINIYTGKNIIVLNQDEAKEHDIYSGYRTRITSNKRSLIALVDVSTELVKPGEVGVFQDAMDKFKIKKGQKIEIIHMNRPESLNYIKKKLDKGTLVDNEIRKIVNDIMQDRLGEGEITAWIAASYINGFSDDEIIALANSTVESGEQLKLGRKPVLDKHCIGGVAGNRTTMLIVPIIAAAGMYIPKTSSRSITSASGTADTMEVLADVKVNIHELKDIVLKAKGAIVWGGGMRLAPVDDKLIRIRHPLSLDPQGMLLASILGKKKSVGAEHVIIDIPIGRGVKVPYMEKGQGLAKHFIKVGERLGMKVEALITDGSEPVGYGVGPALECIDVLEALEGPGRGPEDLRHKSLLMAGKLMELAGKVEKNRGYEVARKLIDSGKALKKFREIVELQGGDGKVKPSDIEIGGYTHVVDAAVGGSIFHIDNKTMAKIARIAGAPRDKGAGVLIHRFRGDRVEKGDRLFTIFAESSAKLGYAVEALEKLEPFEMRKMLLGSMR